MKITVDAAMAKERFEQYDRDYYSLDGLEAIIGYYDEIDENMELDVIAICCDCSEYGEGCALSFSDLISNYEYLVIEGYDAGYWDEMSEAEKVRAIIDELEQHTTVLHVSNGNYVVFGWRRTLFGSGLHRYCVSGSYSAGQTF